MNWTEIIIEVGRKQAESLSDAFLEVGALSVSVEDADLGTPDEQPIFGEPGMEPAGAWGRSRIVVLLDAMADPHALNIAASLACGLEPLPFSQRTVAEQDWVRLTQAQFAPMLIGSSIWVVPSWHEAPAEAGIILQLDPGLAFGTGNHATTRLCMEWLEIAPLAGRSVLDYGSGTGILAMVAAKLGASPVYGVDIDPQAVIAARENSQRNHCEISYVEPDALPVEPFDLVIANILSGPLVVMASNLIRHVKDAGTLVLSGILAEQADVVIAAYEPWVALRIWKQSDGWVVLSGTRSVRPALSF